MRNATAANLPLNASMHNASDMNLKELSRRAPEQDTVVVQPFHELDSKVRKACSLKGSVLGLGGERRTASLQASCLCQTQHEMTAQ